MPDAFGDNPSRSDLKLIERAVRRRWNVSDEVKTKAVAWVRDVLSNPGDYNERTVARCIEIAQHADKLDLDIDKFVAEQVDKEADASAEGVKLVDADFWKAVEERDVAEEDNVDLL